MKASTLMIFDSKSRGKWWSGRRQSKKYLFFKTVAFLSNPYFYMIWRRNQRLMALIFHDFHPKVRL